MKNGNHGYIYSSRTLVLAVVFEGSQPTEIQREYIPLRCTIFQGGVTRVIVFWAIALKRNVKLPGRFEDKHPLITLRWMLQPKRRNKRMVLHAVVTQ